MKCEKNGNNNNEMARSTDIFALAEEAGADVLDLLKILIKIEEDSRGRKYKGDDCFDSTADEQIYIHLVSECEAGALTKYLRVQAQTNCIIVSSEVARLYFEWAEAESQ